MRNSVYDLVETLKDTPFLTENVLNELTFNYTRKNNFYSNKKYADLLRRAVKKGLILRVEAKSKYDKARFRYYLPQ